MEKSGAEQFAYVCFCMPVFILMGLPVLMLSKNSSIKIPKRLYFFVFGGLLGLALGVIPYFKKYSYIVYIPPFHFLLIALPIFIFFNIYRMDYHIFVRCLPQVFIINIVGFVSTVGLLGLIMKQIIHPNWDIYIAFLFAIVLVQIQPENIVLLFIELSKHKYVGTMLNTEYVLLLTPVMMCFDLGLGITESYLSQWYHIVNFILRQIIGSYILGFIMGKTTAFLLCYHYNNETIAFYLSIQMIYITYLLADYIIATSAPFAVFCLTYYVVHDKHKYSSAVDLMLIEMCGLLNYMIEIPFFIAGVASLTYTITQNFILRDLFGTIIIYIAANGVRILTFLTLGPILNLMSYELNIKCQLVLGWSGIKGSISILLAIILREEESTKEFAERFATEFLMFIFLGLLLNGVSMQFILKAIGLLDVSQARRTNMNACMKYLMEKRMNIINNLKLDRYLSDANWNVVRNETLMQHPYKISMTYEENEEEDTYFNSKSALCPDCNKEVTFDVTGGEVQEISKETQIKILKAKKISVIRQYENGNISKNCLQILVHAFENIIESDKKHYTVDISHYMKRNKFLSCAVKLIRKLQEQEIHKPPTILYRRLFFYCIMHHAYYLIIYVMIVTYAILFVYFGQPKEYSVVFGFYIFVACVFTCEVGIKVLAYSTTTIWRGIRTYFKQKWNIFDFVLLLCSFLDRGLLITQMQFILPFEMNLAMVVSILRLIKILQVVHVCYGKIIDYIEYKIDCRICFGYDLATALVNCCDDILDDVNQLVDIKTVRDLYINQIQAEKHGLVKCMEEVQKHRPWIGITVKTKQAIRTTLHSMEDALKELKISGFVDNVEYNVIYKEIFKKHKFLRNLRFVQPSSPKVIFNGVPWMKDEEVKNYLFNHVIRVNWDGGEVVCADGSFSQGIYIVVTGLLRLKYSPKDSVLQKWQMSGCIPIVDYFSTLDFYIKMEDNIMSGDSLGELCVLTGRPYNCTIKADCPSQAYLLKAEVIRDAMKLFPDPITGLEAALWKYGTINLAVAVLMEQYQSYTVEQIKFKLENAFIPNLAAFKIFVVTEQIDDIVLIDGFIQDYVSGELYMAPRLLPKALQKIVLPQNSDTQNDQILDSKLLIIPVGDIRGFEIMKGQEEIAELISMSSSNCLLHMVRDRIKKKRLNKSETKPILTTSSIVAPDISISIEKFEVLETSGSQTDKESIEEMLAKKQTANQRLPKVKHPLSKLFRKS